MTSLLFYNDEETTGKVSIDELYERRQRRDQKQIAIFNKILNRIHKRITTTGKSAKNAKHIWFTIPEYIFGEPNYDQGDCIGYIVSKLETNGFQLKYLHPNTLFVSWENWIPSYVRSEFKKKTGILVDERGNVLKKGDAEDEAAEAAESEDPTTRMLYGRAGIAATSANSKSGKDYTPIGKYKPTGNLVYSPEIFEKIEKRVT